MTEAQQPQPATFQIEKMFVKDMSLEIPHAPKVFLEQVQPQLEVQINTGAENFAEGYYEVSVTATVTARVGERTLFLAEARQAGIFQLRGVSASRRNERSLPGFELPSTVKVAADLAEATQAARLVLAATPVAGLRDVLGQLTGAVPVVWLCKGFEEGTGELPHQVAAAVLGK